MMKQVVIRLWVDENATTKHIADKLDRIVFGNKLDQYMEFADNSLLDGEDRMIITLKAATRATCEVFNVTEVELLSKRRAAQYVVPRQLMYYIGTETVGLSYTKVGKMFKRDHTSVIHGVKVAEKRLSEDKGYRKNLRKVLELAEDIEARQKQALKESAERLRIMNDDKANGKPSVKVEQKPSAFARPLEGEKRSYHYNRRISVIRKDAQGRVINSER